MALVVDELQRLVGPAEAHLVVEEAGAAACGATTTRAVPCSRSRIGAGPRHERRRGPTAAPSRAGLNDQSRCAAEGDVDGGVERVGEAMPSSSTRAADTLRESTPSGLPAGADAGRRARLGHRSIDGATKEQVEMQFGRSYEEFEVGATYKHWPGKTVTEFDDHMFCLLTMNHHPLHLDAHYAEETTQFGKNVVVGNYVYSILLGMSVPDISGKAIANLEIESLRHVAPTFHGDTLYGETTVLDKWESKSKDDRGVVHVETIGYNQDGKVVCIFRRKVMVPKDSYLERARRRAARPAGPAAGQELARTRGSDRS